MWSKLNRTNRILTIVLGASLAVLIVGVAFGVGVLVGAEAGGYGGDGDPRSTTGNIGTVITARTAGHRMPATVTTKGAPGRVQTPTVLALPINQRYTALPRAVASSHPRLLARRANANGRRTCGHDGVVPAAARRCH